MPSEICTRLETLLARTGLNGPIAKAEAAAEAEALNGVLAYFEEIEAEIFLADTQGEGLRRWQRQIRPPVYSGTAGDMMLKMNGTNQLFSSAAMTGLLPPDGPAVGSCEENTCRISGITAANAVSFADALRMLRSYLPPFVGCDLGGSGLTWAQFDALGNRFYDCDRAAFSWQMIETTGG